MGNRTRASLLANTSLLRLVHCVWISSGVKNANVWKPKRRLKCATTSSMRYTLPTTWSIVFKP